MVIEAILKALKDQKHTKHWLAKESRVPRSVVYEGLRGKRPIPLEHAVSMMRTLNLTVSPAPARRPGRRR